MRMHCNHYYTPVHIVTAMHTTAGHPPNDIIEPKLFNLLLRSGTYFLLRMTVGDAAHVPCRGITFDACGQFMTG